MQVVCLILNTHLKSHTKVLLSSMVNQNNYDIAVYIIGGVYVEVERLIIFSYQ